MTSPDPAELPPHRPRARLTAQTLTAADGCPRRLWLRQHAHGEASPPGEHDLVLRELGLAHERAVGKRFADLVGPLWEYGASLTAAAARTRELLRETRLPLYQPALLSPDGMRSGVPDFLYWDGEGLVVLEAKLAHRPETRTDFALQLAHYRALLHESLGLDVIRFEVVDGNGRLVRMQPADDDELARVRQIAERTLASPSEPDILLAHSTCAKCPFYEHCWERAEREGRIEIVPEVQRRHLPQLAAIGARSVRDLAAMEPSRLQGVLPAAIARRAVLAARAWRDGAAAWLEPPQLPAAPIVWFDLEGDSRGLQAEVPIYLWGVALDEDRGEPEPEELIASFEPGGDAEAWERFLACAQRLFASHPEARWIHWDSYEPLWIERYHARYGSPEGFVPRIKRALFDLKRELDRCVRLPLRSYSIKHVAPWMGFRWRNPESGSEWSVAQYHRARETTDPAERARLLREVVEYNADDLWAMRAVWRWLRANGPAARA